MSLDITKIFKANVKAIRITLTDSDDRNELLNEELLGSSKRKAVKNKTSIDQQTSSIAKESRLVIQNITLLKQFLTDNKKEYIQPNYLFNQQTENTDWQLYEDQAEEIIKKCADTTRQLKDKAFSNSLTQQFKEHLENMFYLLEKYLKDVCKIYTEQKAIRVKRVVERKNLSQLCSKDIIDTKNIAIEDENNDFQLIEEIQDSQPNINDLLENDLTEQELLSLESENDFLYDELTSQMQEVKQIEGEVIEVSKLTQIFAENIVSQLSSIETIHKSAVETNSNLTTGNENIKEAMKKNAALRLWILFIIVVLSFTLLFLDWYNE